MPSSGRKKKQQPRQTLGRAEQQQADAAVEAGLADRPGHGQNAEDEDHRVLGVGLGDVIRLQNFQEVHEHPDQQGRHSHGDGTGRPEERGDHQDAEHHLCLERGLLRCQRLDDLLALLVDRSFTQAVRPAVVLGDALAHAHLRVAGVSEMWIAQFSGLGRGYELEEGVPAPAPG